MKKAILALLAATAIAGGLSSVAEAKTNERRSAIKALNRIGSNCRFIHGFLSRAPDFTIELSQRFCAASDRGGWRTT